MDVPVTRTANSSGEAASTGSHTWASSGASASRTALKASPAATLLRAHCLNHGQWPDVPAEPITAKAVDRTRLAELLTASETQLRQLQADSTPDRLWRWYFRLTI